MRPSVFLAVAFGLPLLSGCSTLDNLWGPDDTTLQSEAVQHRLTQLTQDINGCTAKRKSGQSSTRVDYALCINATFQSAMFDVNYPYPDIVATLSAERLRVAELADKGQISDAEGMARINDKISEVVRLERARSNTIGKHAEATPPQYFLQLMQIGI
jgi:hypothetical protein